ncbi:MAG: hypothetical protein LBK56_08165 [Gracilibacteraceae bacterium]|nr:hypothetical protein [Gracilibacteraceae bacterium]
MSGKRVLLIALLAICVFMLIACGAEPPVNDPDQPASDDLAANIDFYKSLSDNELMYKIASDLDLCLIGSNELLFTDPETIPSETLFMFFVYVFNQEVFEGIKDPLMYFNEDVDKYSVPVRDIRQLLQGYFERFIFDLSQVEGYEQAEDSIFINTMSGFGGARFPKLESKLFDKDRLTMTVAYYDGPEYQKISYTKTYEVRFTSDGFMYLSIVRTET